MQMLWEGFVGAFWLIVNRDPAVLDAAFRSFYISSLAVFVASSVGIPFGALLAHVPFPGRRILVLIARLGMSVPTVLIGLICYATFSRQGPLGPLDLLYTRWAIIVGEIMLATPIIISWTHNGLTSLDVRAKETAQSLGAGRLRQIATCLSETRWTILLAILTAFARCLTELGIALMVGGNIAGDTRTLTTATALETSRGDFERGVAMSIILLLVALLITAVASWPQWLGRES